METVDGLRNEIHREVFQEERDETGTFTKIEIARISNEVGYAVDVGQPPKMAKMRAGILREIGVLEEDDPEIAPSSLRKDELKELKDRLN